MAENNTNVSELMTTMTDLLNAKLTIERLNSQISDLKVDKLRLLDNVNELNNKIKENNTPDVIELRNITDNKVYDSWTGNVINKPRIITNILSKDTAVRETITILEDNYKKIITSLEKDLEITSKTLSKEKESKQEEIQRSLKDYKNSADQQIEDLREQNKELNKYIEKLKSRQTAEDIEKETAEKLNVLNASIQVLQYEIEKLTSSNMFKRTMYRVFHNSFISELTKKYASIKAEATNILDNVRAKTYWWTI